MFKIQTTRAIRSDETQPWEEVFNREQDITGQECQEARRELTKRGQELYKMCLNLYGPKSVRYVRNTPEYNEFVRELFVQDDVKQHRITLTILEA